MKKFLLLGVVTGLAVFATTHTAEANDGCGVGGGYAYAAPVYSYAPVYRTAYVRPAYGYGLNIGFGGGYYGGHGGYYGGHGGYYGGHGGYYRGHGGYYGGHGGGGHGGGGH